MLELAFEDFNYPRIPFTHTRLVARAVVLDEKGRVAIHRLKRDDAFGKDEYFETPGGGVDEGETPEEALVRECDEELGKKVVIDAKLAVVTDAYNLIGRQNINHFYLCHIVGESEVHYVSSGDSLIAETLYLPLDAAISLYERMPRAQVSGLVRQRELPVLREAKRVLGKTGAGQ